MQAVHHKTIVVSDLHLGTRSSAAKQLVRFLRSNTCDTLILNGDIIDAWQLKRSGKWKKKHSRLIKLIVKLIDQKKTRIIYIRGNHDDFLDEFLPFEFGSFSIIRDLVYESNGRKYYICHGDVFDYITTRLRFVAKLGDIGYTLLLRINRAINRYRTRRGLPYYSFSQKVKNRVKQAVSYINDFESEMSKIAAIKGCEGVICGHIHHPANRMVDGIHYLNSGDWVETMSALTEDYNGNWEIVYYTAWAEQYIPEEDQQVHEEITPEILLRNEIPYTSV
ncbi:MAG: UDP-2,3-diacylglucosamine diphosphatase [Bacteroidales bacterium]|nr:UDP-2,3-diacylglucosamine diphosphatase [Bacteroidales bacterium]